MIVARNMLLVLLILLLGGAAQANDPSTQGQPAKGPSTKDLNEQIQKLQQERIKLLSQAVEFAMTMFKQGASGWELVVDAQQELLAARLDAASSLKERKSILEEQVKVTKELVKFVTARFDAGNVSVLDLHRAKALALTAEIDLLKLQKAAKKNDD